MSTFHKTAPPWFERAKDLKPGQSRRISDSIKLSFNGFAYQLYDFREKTMEVYQPTLTLEERLRMIAEQKEAAVKAQQSDEPPATCQYHPRDWPADARIWFYDSFLNDDDLREQGWCWDPVMRRVVMGFRLLAGGRTWVARDPWWSRQSSMPKYLRPPKSPGAGLVHTYPSEGIVVTEDLLSALRINAVAGVDAVPLMGTSLSRRDAVLLAQRSENVLLWLDPDGAGGMGQMAVRKALAPFDLNVRGFDRFGDKAKVDPKKQPNDVILSVVSEGFLHG